MAMEDGRMEDMGGEIVDWHSHVRLPEHLGAEFGPELDAHYAHVPSHRGDYDAHRAAMLEGGISRAVVIALCSDYLDINIPNEYVAAYVASDPDHLVGICSVDPNRSSAVDELRYAAVALGLRGLKLAPPVPEFPSPF